METEVTGKLGGSDGGAKETAAFCEFDGDGRIGWVGCFGDGIGVDGLFDGLSKMCVGYGGVFATSTEHIFKQDMNVWRTLEKALVSFTCTNLTCQRYFIQDDI